MKKLLGSFLFFFCYIHTFGQSEFEKAKLEILCQAIRYNHLMQGKAEIANQLDCSSLQSLEKTTPKSSKASKNLLIAYKNKLYKQFPSDKDKAKQLKKEVWAELKALAPRINKSPEFQEKWQKGLDSLSKELDNSLSLSPDEVSTTEVIPENNTNNLEETIIPLERPKTSNAEQSNTGLWIITILAILISFLSVGYAYLTQKTTAHKLKEMDNLVKERYNHLDVRMDKMLTREEYRKQNVQ